MTVSDTPLPDHHFPNTSAHDQAGHESQASGNAFASAFPARPLAIKAASITTPRGYAWAAPLMFILAGALAYWQVPDLLRDYRISQNPMVLEDGQLRDGKCKTTKGVFTNCEAHLVYSYQGRHYEGDAEIFFVDVHAGDYESDIVIEADHPELATLSLGIDMLWNRIISFLVLFGLIAFLCVTSVFLGIRVAWVRSRLPTPMPLTPIPVEITTFKKSFGRLFVSYADKLTDDRTKRTAHTRFARGREPIIIGESDGKAVALAVRHGRTALPVLLDNRLERIRMTEEERASALAVIEASQSQEPARAQLRDPPKKGGFLRGIVTFLAIMLVLAAVVMGYWLWYVTSAETQFVQVGMEINNILPAPLNEWGCDQLQKRFGDQNAPYGCTAGDYRSWK